MASDKITPNVVETPMSPTIASPTSPNNRNSLYAWQTLVGDVDSRAATADQAETLYQNILQRQRKAHAYFIVSAIAVYTSIALQIILCLGIAVGAQYQGTDKQPGAFTPGIISGLAAVNTAVAATIGILKGLGLPEKKAIERIKLSKMAERIRTITRKLRAGFDVDVEKEADGVREIHDAFEDETIADLQNLGKAAYDSYKASPKAYEGIYKAETDGDLKKFESSLK